VSRPTIEECAMYQRQVNVAMRSEQPVTVSLALEIAKSVIDARTKESDYRGRRAGTQITIQNTVEQIPNSVVGSQGIGESDGD
jgi:hypothetical protein